MSRLPSLGEFDFLWSCKLTPEQAAELSALAERWQSLVDRRGNPDVPAETQVPPKDEIAFHNEYLSLFKTLHAFGVRHGFISEPKQASPHDPVKEVREAIRLHRGILDELRNIPAHFQGGIDKLWELWRGRLPEHEPPARPQAVSDRQQALDATDALQRELNRQFPLASSQAPSRDEASWPSPSSRPTGPASKDNCMFIEPSHNTSGDEPQMNLTDRAQAMRQECLTLRDVAERLHKISQDGHWQEMVDELWLKWSWYFPDGPAPPIRPAVSTGMEVADAANSLVRELDRRFLSPGKGNPVQGSDAGRDSERGERAERLSPWLAQLQDMAKLSADGGRVTGRAIRTALQKLQEDASHGLSEGVWASIYQRMKDVAGWQYSQDINLTDRAVDADESGNIYHRITLDQRSFPPDIEQLWTDETWPSICEILNTLPRFHTDEQGNRNEVSVADSDKTEAGHADIGQGGPFLAALSRLLDASANYWHSSKTRNEYTQLEALYIAAVHLAPPSISLPPLEQAGFPLNHVEIIPVLIGKPPNQRPGEVPSTRTIRLGNYSAWQEWQRRINALGQGIALAGEYQAAVKPGETGQTEGVDGGNDQTRTERSEGIGLKTDQTESKAKQPKPVTPSRKEANILIRQYLNKHPKDYSIRKAKQETGISTGRICKLPAWLARPPRNASEMNNGRSNRRERELTEAILNCVEVENDPSDQASLREAAWVYLERKAKDEKERSRLQKMSDIEREQAIALVIEQFDEQIPE